MRPMYMGALKIFYTNTPIHAYLTWWTLVHKRGKIVALTKIWIFGLDRSTVLFFAVCFTNVHQVTSACMGVVVECNAVFRLMISCSNPEIFAIKLRRCSKSHQNCDILGHQFFGEGDPKFRTQFYKLQSPSNMWQSLVMIGQETFEIRRRKKM